jgi:hypothetical protein
MPCQWTESAACPFSAPNDVFVEFEGRQYCPLHLPLRSNQKENAANFAARFIGLQDAGVTEFMGVSFPGTIAPNYARYDARRNFNLIGCDFGDRVQIVANTYDIDLSTSVMTGSCNLNIGSAGVEVTCVHTTFLGALTVDVSDQPCTLVFNGSDFRSTVQLNFVAMMRALNFRACKFAHPPSFPRSEKIPQRTNFYRATFTLHAEDESAFRAIRNYFSDHRARDPEGRFYALEKRCHRLSMTRPREWTPRAISFLYDLSSEYGYSYGWALFWFIIIQIGFGLAYAGLSDRLFHPGGHFDSRVVAFTFAQVVKPFELFSGKAPTADAYAIIPNVPSGWWLFLTALQSVLSITLIALFLLAIRWRFRRE